MNLLTKTELLFQIAKWRLTWSVRNIDLKPKRVKNPKFITARQAAGLIPDGACVVTAGMAGNMRASIFYWAIREAFEQTGHPRDLTLIAVGGLGGRGIVPGTCEELALKGLLARFISGHLETQKAILALAQEGNCELQTMCQGMMTFLIDGQSRGEEFLVSKTGVGTCLDPRVGNGSPVVKGVGENYIAVDPDGLRFRLPKITASICVADAADEDGNIYMYNANMYTETREGALAAHHSGGPVLVSVARIVPKDPARIFLPADKVTAVVINPRNEQTGSVSMLRPWKMFLLNMNVDTMDAVERLRFINNVLGITPKRGPVEHAMARLAASLFTRLVKPGAIVNIGTGLPEEVCRLVHEGGLLPDINFCTETGVYGGLPTPGVFFGAGINPKMFISSAEMFRLTYERLDMTILGLLQADSDGNVNVSKRGEGPINYVGPGGFTDLTHAAKNIIFIGTWMAHSKMKIVDGRLKIVKPGTHKFMKRVDEITFNGAEALAKGKNIFYVTNVGVFQLTERGMELVQVMPGINIRGDILEACPMKIVLPADGNVPVVDPRIVTGEGFKLVWEKSRSIAA